MGNTLNKEGLQHLAEILDEKYGGNGGMTPSEKEEFAAVKDDVAVLGEKVTNIENAVPDFVNSSSSTIIYKPRGTVVPFPFKIAWSGTENCPKLNLVEGSRIYLRFHEEDGTSEVKMFVLKAVQDGDVVKLSTNPYLSFGIGEDTGENFAISIVDQTGNYVLPYAEYIRALRCGYDIISTFINREGDKTYEAELLDNYDDTNYVIDELKNKQRAFSNVNLLGSGISGLDTFGVMADAINISANETYKTIKTSVGLTTFTAHGVSSYCKPGQTWGANFEYSTNIGTQNVGVCANRDVVSPNRLSLTASGTNVSLTLMGVTTNDNGLKFYVYDTRSPELKSDVVMVSVVTEVKTQLYVSADYDSDGNALVTGLFVINKGGAAKNLVLSLAMSIDGETQNKVYTSEPIQKNGNTYIYSRFSVSRATIESLGDKAITLIGKAEGTNYTKSFTKEEIGL